MGNQEIKGSEEMIPNQHVIAYLENLSDSALESRIREIKSQRGWK